MLVAGEGRVEGRWEEEEEKRRERRDESGRGQKERVKRRLLYDTVCGEEWCEERWRKSDDAGGTGRREERWRSKFAGRGARRDEGQEWRRA